MDDIEKRVEKLEIELKNVKKQNEQLTKDFLDVQLEYEMFRDLTSDEFERTWISFRNIRDNFRAIGYNLRFGSHLDKKDKMPRKNKRAKKN
jgi:hypothetical protein